MDVQYKRDERTGLIVNNDDTHYQQILQRRQSIKNAKQVEQRLANLELKLTIIENTLLTMLSRK